MHVVFVFEIEIEIEIEIEFGITCIHLDAYASRRDFPALGSPFPYFIGIAPVFPGTSG